MINHLFGAAALFFFGLFAVPHMIAAGVRYKGGSDAAAPLVGGLALYALWMLGVAYNVPFEPELLVLVCSTTLLTLLGLYSDIMPQPLSFTIFSIIFALLPTFKARFFLSTTLFPPIVMAVYSLVWATAIIGGFSYLEQLPGLSLTLAISTGLGFLTIASMTGDTLLAAAILFFILAVGVVLLHTSGPQRLAVGKSGTFFIGGFFAIVAFMIEWEEICEWGILVPSFLLLLPLAEAALQYIAIRRGLHRRHLVNVLLGQKWHPTAIMLALFIAGIAVNMLSLFFLHTVISPLVYVISVLTLIGAFALFILLQKRYLTRSSE